MEEFILNVKLQVKLKYKGPDRNYWRFGTKKNLALKVKDPWGWCYLPYILGFAYNLVSPIWFLWIYL